MFVGLTLVACLVLDTSIGMLRSEKQDMAQFQPLAPAQGEPMPVIDPPTIRMAPPARSSPANASLPTPTPIALPSRSDTAMVAVDLPQPQDTKNGLVLATFQEATQLCRQQGKRLPSIMETAKWAANNGALVASVQDAKRLRRDVPANAIYLQRGAQTQTVDFYFDKDRFVYPARRPVTNAAIWTSDERMLGGPAKATHYAFSPFSASFSPVPTSSMLAVVCMENTTSAS